MFQKGIWSPCWI